MALSGDLVAPLTDLCTAPEALPDRSPRQGSSALGYSTDVLCPTASSVDENGKHGSHTPTDRTTLQINLCAFVPMLHTHRAALSKIPHEE